MAVSENIKYNFNQIFTNLEAFVTNLESKLQYICGDTLPVFILQTGDKNYYFSKKFTEIVNKEIYEKVPRFVMTIGDIPPNSDENTNQYNEIEYIFEEQIYTATARRVALVASIDCNFVSSNYIKALENYEIMLSILSRENPFTYEFLGNNYESAYALSNISNEKPSMDISSASIDNTVKIQIDLQIQLFTPRVETIRLKSELGYREINFEITSVGDINHEDFLKANLEELRRKTADEDDDDDFEP